MREFKDSAGRKWELVITVGAVGRVQQETGVLLTALFDDGCKVLGELSADVVKLVSAIYCLCRKQAEAACVSAEEFADALGGDTLGAAGEALVRATADFFTSPEQRATAHAMLDKLQEVGQQVTSQATTIVVAVDVAQLVKNYLGSVTNTPASLASTLTT